MYRLAAALAALLLAAAPSAAGDAAEREIIGFSPDGTHFAFAEYGIQDGSGFPYANIFVLDTKDDRWVEETPVRVLLDDDEPRPLAEARKAARAKAEPILKRLSIAPGGTVVASNPPTETSADPHAVRFEPRYIRPSSQDEWRLTLTERELALPSCPDIGMGPFKGFRLVLQGPDGKSLTLNDDERIPQSRGCPLGYAISDAITFFPQDGEPVLVVLVSIFRIGFEGPDRRFLALAARPGF